MASTANHQCCNDRGRKIKLLVCTANMGNAEPDHESINSWIPIDGEAKLVLENQSYPSRDSMKETFKSAAKAIMETRNNQITSVPEGEAINIDVNSKADKFDIIAIGMQEATFELSEASHTKFSKRLQKVTTTVEQFTQDENYQKGKKNNTLTNIRKKFTSNKNPMFDELAASPVQVLETDTCLLHDMLQEHLPSYKRAVSYQRGQMRMLVFYNESAIEMEVISVKAQNTGRGGLANKGGIVAECDINSGTRISFLSAHLEAHEGTSKYNTRCSSLGDILWGTAPTVADFKCDVSMTSHYTFVMGDLNFRTRLPEFEIGSLEHIKEAHNLAKNNDWNTLNEHDELALALKNKDCLVGFSTPECNFPPTFKVERKDGYNYNPKRSPSYTDRILYKANHGLSESINIQAYEPIDHFTTSDHKPIRSAFEIQLNPSLKWRPILRQGHRSFRYFRSRGRKLKGLEGKNLPNLKSENLHVFISSIECNIGQGPLPSSLYCPSPCVSFVPTPANAIIQKGSAIGINWSIFQKNGGNHVKMRFPQTKPIRNTLNPKWDGEINFRVQTHDNTGTPVDLTGSMLHVMVLDKRDNFNLLGSCTINLASLIDASKNRRSMGSFNVCDNNLNKKRNLAIAFAASLFSRLNKSSKDFSTPLPDHEKSVANVDILQDTSVKLESSIKSNARSSSSCTFNSLQYREELIKNGEKIGSIKFDMETLWLDDESLNNPNLVHEWRGR